jgi:hypothetical protein
MLYAGIDYHKRYSQVYVIDDGSEAAGRRETTRMACPCDMAMPDERRSAPWCAAQSFSYFLSALINWQLRISVIRFEFELAGDLLQY